MSIKTEWIFPITGHKPISKKQLRELFMMVDALDALAGD